MKKLILTILVLMTLSMSIYAQQSYVQRPVNYDYGIYKSNCNTFITSLENVFVADDYTYVHLKLHVLKNGTISFPSSIYIQGEGFRKQVLGVFDPNSGSTINLNKWYTIHKKQQLDVVLIFGTIPVGINKISYIEPNFISFQNIPIENPDTSIHTDWDENLLVSWWDKNGISDIEGIYEFLDCDNMDWWGSNKFSVAVKKEGRNYQIIYLDGNEHHSLWKEGDIKAIMKPTAVPNLFKASWYMDTKRINDNMYITFDTATLTIKDKEHNVEARFIKMYPTSQYGSRGNGGSHIDNNAIEYTGSGSGIIISTNGVVVTNHHVIKNAQNIDIVVKDNLKVLTYKAKVLATDKINDLALLLIDDNKFTRFENIPFALSSTTSEVGTSVFAMGYPLAFYMGEEVKITDGIISSKTGYQGDIVTYQISAPIQPGNSGGPLFDKQGNLIGITNAGITDAQNVGYAIKASYLKNLTDAAPVSISLPSNNIISELPLTEQIKRLTPYVVLIKVN